MTAELAGWMGHPVTMTLGAVLLASLFFVLEGNLQWLALIGVVPLLRGILGTCPLYSLMGIDTCPLREQRT